MQPPPSDPAAASGPAAAGGPAAASGPAEGSVKRTSEIEEWTNRVAVHPVSRALVTVLARRAVSPNAVSLAGLALGAGAAWAYLGYASPARVALGFALMVGWHVADGADGQLARLTGKTSEIGRALDGLADHGTFVLVYLALAAAAAEAQGAWVWAWAVAAGASHAVQASTYEAQRYAYDYWVQGKASARVPTPDEARAEMAGATGAAWALGQLNLLYLTVQHRTGAAAGPVPARLAEAASGPGGRDRVARAYRATHRAGVRRWNALCSNYRTVAIAVACLVGSPVWFFAFEAVVLNAVFAALVAMTRRDDRALLAQLDAVTAPS